MSNNSLGGTFPADWLLPSTLENLILGEQARPESQLQRQVCTAAGRRCAASPCGLCCMLTKWLAAHTPMAAPCMCQAAGLLAAPATRLPCLLLNPQASRLHATENVSLAGPLPTNWRWPAKLSSFNLMTNQLTGSIPDSFAGRPSLQVLPLATRMSPQLHVLYRLASQEAALHGQGCVARAGQRHAPPPKVCCPAACRRCRS